jgi:hypothetical protein
VIARPSTSWCRSSRYDNKESLPATQFNMKWVETAACEVRLPRAEDADRDREGLRAGRPGKIDIAKIPLTTADLQMPAKGDASG